MNESKTIEPQHCTAPVSVRVLTPVDAEAYRAVRLLALNEYPPAFGSLPEEEPNLQETAARLTDSDNCCFFGAFQEEQLIGIIRFSRYSAPNEKHRAYIAGLYVISCPDNRLRLSTSLKPPMKTRQAANEIWLLE